jgi:hypothetical protein
MQETLDLTGQVLGQTQGIIGLPDLASMRAACAHMADQSEKELAILSHDLDAPLYDHTAFLRAVRRLALRGGHHVPVRILLGDPEPAVRKGHRLVELARRHPSHIQIRQVPAELDQQSQAYLIVDARGYVLRRVPELREGTADYDAPLVVRRLRGQFDRLWDHSPICQDTRAFGRGL